MRSDRSWLPYAFKRAPHLRSLILQSFWKTAVFFVVTSAGQAHTQGILTVTPSRLTATTAGTGTLGYAADGISATSATFASPSAVAYDVAGNLYIADAKNNVVRELLKSSGLVMTVTGTGIAGFSGDGGASIAAQLDTPTGIALDTKGNLYIADSHNHRIREVINGTISTFAGIGTPGFAGDGGQATAAQLALPSAVAIDANGRLLIADTNNQRIRAVANGVITTVVGDGEELFAGDGGPATAASLDQPTGLAVDSAGNLYIADRHNQRIRVVNTIGTITTLAGSGSGLAGSFSGDGASAASATLAKPTSVSVDAAGNVYIADTNNQRIREVSSGAIGTIAGTGEQGYAGDGGALTSAVLNAPKAAVIDSTGNLLIADTLNQRLRSGILPTLSFANTAVGAASASQSLTLANTGTANLTVSQLTASASFTLAAGTCTALPVTLAPGASCTENIAFMPTAAGAVTGSVTVSGSGLVPQTVLLTGTGVQGASTTTLTANTASALVGQPVTFTATVQSGGSGTVSFYDGATQIGTAQTVTNNLASLTLTTLTAGTHSITAVYSGNASYAGSTSAAVAELIGDFDFSITSGATGTTGSAGSGTGSATQSVVPGQSVTYAFTVQPLSGPFNFPITLSATGLPSGATVTFSPPTLTVGAAPAGFTMTVQTTATTAALQRTENFGGGTLAFALLLLPFSGTVRRRARQLGPLSVCLALVGTGIVTATLTGCGSGNGFFGQAQKTYTIEVVGTAKGANGTTLQHVADVQLTLQ